MKHFDIHVVENFSDRTGYSIIMHTDKDLSIENPQEIIKEAKNQELIDDEDARYVDFIRETDEDDNTLGIVNLFI